MQKKMHVHAYIDGANLYNGIKEQGWILDYKKFRIWLREKHGVENAYIFIGMIPAQKHLYKKLEECGFLLVFKEVVYNGTGIPKGNCDADLVVQCVCDFFDKKYERALLVTSDGDYAGVVRALDKRSGFLHLVSPASEKKCSILLKRTGVPMTFLGDVRLRPLLEKNKKAPDADRTAQGSFL